MSSDDAIFEELLSFIHSSRGFDFSGYKRTSLTRRIRKRMEAVGCADYAAYMDFLEVHPEEFPQLFDTILINVTSFFRDPQAWTYLTDVVLPEILEGKDGTDPIRIWSAACASGEEVYTIAMVLAEKLGMKTFKERVKIYATDVDE